VRCEYELTAVKNSRVTFGNVNSQQKSFFLDCFRVTTAWESLQFDMPNELSVGIVDGTPASFQYYVEKRNLKNGRLTSTKKCRS
jgi:hypothetical protein